ncbi:hypothetical protein C8F04DRAFT_1253950 [Mycena alexandri]|uniref:F-box domain-containing protein n=1 Tax=Mycena alexandri TaxID=1745969 RepID=A0AAD6TB33_9AGAR|nr:hypothetical protein C8F04DRAFT_1253950 [Mycena alexandri]
MSFPSLVEQSCVCATDADLCLCPSVRCLMTGLVGAGLMNALERLSPAELFHRALSSPEGDAGGRAPISRAGAFESVPPELLDMIALQLSMRDRAALEATCRLFRAVVRMALQTSAARSLGVYSLSFIDLRFLQSSMTALVTGAALRDLIFTGEAIRWPSWASHDPTPVVPPTLDFYCSRFEAVDAATFLSHATGRVVQPATDVFDPSGALQEVYALTKPGSPDIRVFETFSDNPMDAILHLPSTSDMNVWTLDRVLVPYPRVMFAGVSLTSPDRLPLYGDLARRRAWDVVHSGMQNGFRFASQWVFQHTCSRNPSCPVTWRTTSDRGCLSLPFPTLPLTRACPEVVWKSHRVVSWTLHAAGLCRKGSPPSRTYRHHEYLAWTDEVTGLVKRRIRPP